MSWGTNSAAVFAEPSKNATPSGRPAIHAPKTAELAGRRAVGVGWGGMRRAGPHIPEPNRARSPRPSSSGSMPKRSAPPPHPAMGLRQRGGSAEARKSENHQDKNGVARGGAGRGGTLSDSRAALDVNAAVELIHPGL